MFGLGMMEILMILAIALIVVGPQKLPELAKTLGRAMGEFKRSAQDLKRSIDIETTVGDIDVPKTDLKEILKEKTKDAESDVSSEEEEKNVDEATESADETQGESDQNSPASADDPASNGPAAEDPADTESLDKNQSA